MSWSTNRRDALDQSKPVPHRASHARSCAMLVAQKWRVDRDAVFSRVQYLCCVDLTDGPISTEIERAVEILDELRFNWPDQR